MSPLALDAHTYDRDQPVVCISETLLIPGPVGPLEALLALPEAESGEYIAILCHPHPLYGGTMHNKVVHLLARTLNELNIPTVRFNFRGVGGSVGAYGNGSGETDDLLAVIDYVQVHFPGRHLLLTGFSFGAYVALNAATKRHVHRLITVAPPVNLFDFKQLTLPHCPWLVIQGEQDEIVPRADVAAWLASLPTPPRAEFLSDTGHFFHGKLGALRAMLVAALAPPSA
ncbi:MAG: alpha/beta fold hydrolase [Pseudomonadota bacterium]|mgnify:CR=1 FL=1